MTSITYFTPTQVAELLGISAQTLRRWAGIFQSHLSEGANPAPGEHRRFSQADIAVLRNAQELVKQGMALGQVSDHLASTGQVLDANVISAAAIDADALDVIARSMAQLADQHERIARLETAVADLQQKVQILLEITRTNPLPGDGS